MSKKVQLWCEHGSCWLWTKLSHFLERESELKNYQRNINIVTVKERKLNHKKTYFNQNRMWQFLVGSSDHVSQYYCLTENISSSRQSWAQPRTGFGPNLIKVNIGLGLVRMNLDLDVNQAVWCHNLVWANMSPNPIQVVRGQDIVWMVRDPNPILANPSHGFISIIQSPDPTKANLSPNSVQAIPILSKWYGVLNLSRRT